jgi:transcriptional regulator with AAA-type ATPase domain
MERVLVIYHHREWMEPALRFLQGRKVTTLADYSATLEHLKKSEPYDAVCCGWDKKFTIPIFAKALERSAQTRCIAIGSSKPEERDWIEEFAKAWNADEALKKKPFEKKWLLPDPFTSHDFRNLFPPTVEGLISELSSNAAVNDRPVLIEGEPGTGKKTLALEIHRLSQRGQTSAVSKIVHCDAGTSTEQLLGALQHSTSDQPTLTVSSLELAEGGTLILAGVEHLRRPAQATLLELLEDPAMTFIRPGSRNRISADVRVIATANLLLRPFLDDLFSSELFYRLSSNYIRLPALRERPMLVERLAGDLLRRLRSRAANAAVSQSVPSQSPAAEGPFSPEALRVLNLYPWPNNLRELKFVIEYAALRAPAPEQIDLLHLPPWLVNAADRAER